MPLYAICDKATGRSVLVEADRPASALRIVTDRIYAITTPTPLEAAMLASEGAPILREGAVEEPPAVEPGAEALSETLAPIVVGLGGVDENPLGIGEGISPEDARATIGLVEEVLDDGLDPDRLRDDHHERQRLEREFSPVEDA